MVTIVKLICIEWLNTLTEHGESDINAGKPVPRVHRLTGIVQRNLAPRPRCHTVLCLKTYNHNQCWLFNIWNSVFIQTCPKTESQTDIANLHSWCISWNWFVLRVYTNFTVFSLIIILLFSIFSLLILFIPCLYCRMFGVLHKTSTHM